MHSTFNINMSFAHLFTITDKYDDISGLSEILFINFINKHVECAFRLI